MNLVDTLTHDRPKLHILPGDNQLHDFHSNIALLADLEQLLSPNLTTIETGCGWSTVVFANSGTTHTCITPRLTEWELAKDYCASRKITTDKVRVIAERSETALPALASDFIADLALVDGRHAFPSPMIDWFYLSRHLKIGGTMIIDDIDIRSGQIVYQFMSSDKHWRLVKQSANYAYFAKLGDDSAVEWWRQQNWSQYKVGFTGPLESIKFKVGRLIKR